MHQNDPIDITILEIPFGDLTKTETISVGLLELDDDQISLDISIDGDIIEIGTAKELSEDRFGEGYWERVMDLVYKTYANLVKYEKDLVCGTTGKVLVVGKIGLAESFREAYEELNWYDQNTYGPGEDNIRLETNKKLKDLGEIVATCPLTAFIDVLVCDLHGKRAFFACTTPARGWRGFVNPDKDGVEAISEAAAKVLCQSGGSSINDSNWEDFCNCTAEFCEDN